MLVWLVILGCGGRPPESVVNPVAATEATPVMVPALAGCVAQDASNWGACADQTVTLTATRQEHEPSAPLLNGPGQEQAYFEVGDQPLIVVSTTPIPCDTAEFVGVLRLHDQGGPAGTPESWRGWVIDATAVTCSVRGASR